jgi:hypothetical protein
MNERIKQLAGAALDKAVPYTWTKLDYNQIHELLACHAELIVEECGNWIVDNAGAMEHLGPSYFAKAMQKDFGVK